MEYLSNIEILQNKNKIKQTLKEESAFELYFKKQIIDFIESIHKSSIIVDIGAGSGRFLSYLNQHGFSHLIAVDIDNYLDDDIKENIDFHQCDLSFDRIPLHDNSVDIIACFQVIEHLENPWHFIREAYRILKNNGIFLISFPTSKDIFSRLKFLRSGNVESFTIDNNHISFFPQAVQDKLFKKFRIIRKYFVKTPIYCFRIYGLRKFIKVVLGIKNFPQKQIFSIKTLFFMKKNY